MLFCVNLGKSLEKLLSYLKSAPFNLSDIKFHVKEKNTFGSKIASFRLELKKFLSCLK